MDKKFHKYLSLFLFFVIISISFYKNTKNYRLYINALSAYENRDYQTLAQLLPQIKKEDFLDTLLVRALKVDDVQLVKLMFDTLSDYDNYSFYFEKVIENKDTAILDFLIDEKKQNFCASTYPLFLAIYDSNVYFIKKIIDNYHLCEGYTPLHAAVEAGSVYWTKYCLDTLKLNVNDTAGENSITPLGIAAREYNLPLVKLLLKYGANPNLPDSVYYNKPLYSAATSMYPNFIKILLQHGANPNDTAFTDFTAFLYGMKYSSFSKTESVFGEDAFDPYGTFLLFKKYNTDFSKTYDGNSLLHYCCQNFYDERLLKELLNYIDVNAEDSSGNTPILVGFTGYCVDTLRANDLKIIYLVKHGADINHQNLYGNTVLHKAVEYGHVPLIEFLLKNGADPSITNVDEEKPADLISQCYYDDIAKKMKKIFKKYK